MAVTALIYVVAVLLAGADARVAIEQAVKNANCKDGSFLFTEPASNLVGCYKFFNDLKNWTQAFTSCYDCTTGFCGQLVAIRTQQEQQFVAKLAMASNGASQRYWTSGRSNNAGAWLWDSYAIGIKFQVPWITDGSLTVESEPARTASSFKNSFILAGKGTPYDWDFVSLAQSADTNNYVCRKDACSPESNVVNGICSTVKVTTVATLGSSSSKTSISESWVAAPVIIGVIVVIVVVLIYMKYHKNDTYVRLKKRMSFRPDSNSTKKDSLRMASLIEENEALRAQLNSLTGSNDVIPRVNLPAPVSAPMPTTAALPKLNKPTSNSILSSTINTNKSDLETGVVSPPRSSISPDNERGVGQLFTGVPSPKMPLPSIDSVSQVKRQTSVNFARPTGLPAFGPPTTRPAPKGNPFAGVLPRPSLPTRSQPASLTVETLPNSISESNID